MVDTYTAEVVRIALLAGDDGVVRNMVFERCDIKGPAVLVFQNSTVEHNTFRGDADALFWEIGEDRSAVLGAILLDTCRFTGCTFENVGIAGTREALAPFRNA